MIARLAVGLLFSCLLVRGDDSEGSAIKLVENLGGKYERDQLLPGKPVVTVMFLDGEVPAAALRQLAAFKQLRRIDFYFNDRIGDAHMNDLASLRDLQSIDLSGTKVTDEGLKELAALKDLRELYLSNTRITDAGVKELSSLKELRTLYLGNTKVSDDGLKCLGALARLESLHLGNTAIKGLKELPALPNLRLLILWNTVVNDEDVKRLLVLQRLEKLDLAKTRVTDAGVTALQRALPKCQIER